MADSREVYSIYVLAYAQQEARPYGEFDKTLASSLGCIHSRSEKMLMPTELAARLREMCAAPEATQDDDCDVGPSERDRRIMAEEHRRLLELIHAGGKVETGGRSLYESAGDEIVRLRAENEQTKEALQQARAKVDELRDDLTIQRGRAEGGAVSGAAEMRERAARRLEDAHGMPLTARDIRALPLSGAPATPHPLDVDARDRRRSDTFRALDAAGAPFGEAMAAASAAAGEQAGLSAEDAETLRRGGRVEVDAAIVRKAPAPARGTPGKATGAEAAGTGKDSVADYPAGLQACSCPGVDVPRRGALLGRCNTCNGPREFAAKAEAPRAQGGAALPKPKRVEVGQRWSVDWRDLTGEVDEYKVETADNSTARLIGGAKGVSYRPTAEMLTSLRWTFLGPAPTPQGPSPRDGFTSTVDSGTPGDPMTSPNATDTATADVRAIEKTAPTAAESTDGPTARDAVAGMLLRAGFGTSARDVVDGARIAGVADELRSYPGNPAVASCIAALEALARGDLRGARDHQDLLAALERLQDSRDAERTTVRGAVTRLGAPDHEGLWPAAERVVRERDEARAEAAALREELDRIQREWEEQGARLHAIESRPAPQLSEIVEAVIDVVTDYVNVPDARTQKIRQHLQDRLREELATAERENEHSLHDEKRSVRLTCPKGADARAVAAACVELLGLSSDEVHGGNVVEAFEAGVAEGERRAKDTVKGIADVWMRRQKSHHAQSERDRENGYRPGDDRYYGRAVATERCAVELRTAFGIEPTDPGKPPTVEPAPEASEVVAPPATTAVPEAGTVSRSSDGVTITARDGMTLAEMWEAIKARPELRVCLEAELRQARESARGTTPADLETARRDIRAAVLDDAFRAGVESVNVNRAALLELATGWEARETGALKRMSDDMSGHERGFALGQSNALTGCVRELRRLLDAPRGPGGGERPEAPPEERTADTDAALAAFDAWSAGAAFMGDTRRRVVARGAFVAGWRARGDAEVQRPRGSYRVMARWPITPAAPPQDGSAVAQDERWQPGAVWEHRGYSGDPWQRLHVDAAGTNAAGQLLVSFRDCNLALDTAALTEFNGWRYVGPAKAG